MITVVSGLPRSGTSLMMQMLTAGGVPPLSDGLRHTDEDNPRGYYEWEKIKELPRDPGVIDEAEGKLVKVISALLVSLPEGREYRILFMRRPLEEVIASQGVMIRRRGTTGGALAAPAMMAALQTHLKNVQAWLAARPSIPVHWVDYPGLLAEPVAQARAIAAFLNESGLNVNAMAACVDPALYRNRKTV